MTLRRKLLLVALCTLALPLAGWLYVRQVESLLRTSQAQALTASAHAVARSLVVIGAALPSRDGGWYVQQTLNSMLVDGYADDWAPLTPWAQSLGQNAHVLLARDKAWLYLYVTVDDTTRTRVDADDPAAVHADHLVLALARGASRRSYLLASAAPGAFSAVPLDGSAVGFPQRLNGQWQEDGSGYRIELRLPRALGIDALGLKVHDASGHDASRQETSKPDATGDGIALRPLLRLSAPISAELGELAPGGVRARLLGPHAWLLAQSGQLRLTDGDAPGWLASSLYRLLIAAPLEDSPGWTEDAPRLRTPLVAQALAGKPASAWQVGEQPGSVVLSVAVPVVDHGSVRGALLLEQASRAVPLLANRALFGLLLASVVVLLLAGMVLFAFATRLGARLSRLRDAAERAQANDGRYPGVFPLVTAGDELGDLARSFAKLFDAVGGYTDYLRTLASKLSHELNTPLAIVKSSLDNLEHSALPDDAQPYLARARDGVARMGMLVRAMSEASRMERAIAASEAEDVDLVEVVRGCVESYRPLAGERCIDADLPATPIRMHGAPELIAQALDKLFDNALSFSAIDGWIRIRLRATDDGVDLEVANQGPLLPDAMQGRLFDSLVSLRDQSVHGDAPHLGLGLYVVRLVAERHGGTASARNLADGSGVAFTLHLRGMPRQRLLQGADHNAS